jgi:hypothetical protein
MTPPPGLSDWWRIAGFLALFAFMLWFLGTTVVDPCYGPPGQIPKDCEAAATAR